MGGIVMIIPEQIRVGSTFYTVKAQVEPIVNNGLQCYGYGIYNKR